MNNKENLKENLNWKEIFPKNSRIFETQNGILYNGDALDILPLFEKETIDTIITDIPYGITAQKWDSIIPLEEMWDELKKIRKKGTAIVLFGSEPFSSKLRLSNIKEFKFEWIWNKKNPSNPMLAKLQPLRIHEVIHVFGKGKIKYNPQMRKGKPRKEKKIKKACKTLNMKERIDYYDNKGLYYPTSIIEFSNANRRNKVHPTQKPLELMEYLIKTFSDKNDIILDFTAGSGTTLLAAEKLERKWIGIEIEKKYCDIIIDRFNNNNN